MSTHETNSGSPGFGSRLKPSAEESANAAAISKSTIRLVSAARSDSGNPAGANLAYGTVGAIEEGPPLVAIVGPTAAGKSALALALAESLDGEIVNYDSVQVYRGFDIGSGKLPEGERRGIPHHLLDCLEAEEQFTAGDYRRQALRVLAGIKERSEIACLRRRHGTLSARSLQWPV